MFFAFKAAMFSRAITLLEYIMVYINARDSTFRTVDEFDKIIFTVCIRARLSTFLASIMDIQTTIEPSIYKASSRE